MDDPAERDVLHASLLDWYERQRRALPWRASRDPYCIWVSEIMLQQTQVATVIGYYERWMQRFPTLERLANAEESEVLLAWEGLGYYSRARNLQSAARRVLQNHGGALPRTLAELRSLPGIGAYSAGAIASIAFDLDEPAVDGNIVRVLCRLFALDGDPSRAPLRERIWRLARQLIPAGRARDFNQALMELGATCCTPRAPRCERCPVRKHCAAQAEDNVEAYPNPKARPKVTHVRRAAAVIQRSGKVLVVRAPPDAPRWAGMWQFPDTELGAEDEGPSVLEKSVAESTGVIVNALDRIGNLQHQVTRFRIAIDVYACRPKSGRPRPLRYAEVRWMAIAALGTLAMPAAHRKIARSLE
jgi:A/G-specific adenine glycosylase